jgi:dTDP-D-glucose 4,6-dehydratase
MKRKLLIDLAEEKLVWKPKVKLEDGFRKTIDNFEGILNNE